MKKFVCFLFLLLPLAGWAQSALSPKAEKQLQAAINLYEKGNRTKGIENARAVLDEYPTVRSLWDLLAQMHQQNMEAAQIAFNTAMNKSLEDMLKDLGKEDKKKKSSKKNNLFEAMGPYIGIRLNYMAYLREATLKSRSTVSSMFLRNEEVDPAKPDSLVGSKAQQAFDRAEIRFTEGNYQDAIPFYQEAMEMANGPYFSAQLYLGDSYFMLSEYDSAAIHFLACSQAFPAYIEPHKYLADCYAKQYEFDKAIASCSEALFIYPDASMFMKLEECAKFQRKQYNDGWMVRGCYPYSPTQSQNVQIDHGFWADYGELSKTTWAKSDSLGVITTPSEFEDETYAEVYVWKKLLEKYTDSNNPQLAFAHSMQQKGYLDCYVFLSLFHFDLYPTYRHFIANHKEKAATYLRDVVIYK